MTEEMARAALRRIDALLAQRKMELYRPYPKQREFHAAGAIPNVRERLLRAGNQVGKTMSASAEVAMHLTGKYPDWWEGLRFDRPITAMAASETGKLTRDGVQVHLCGWPKYPLGQGMIPAADILETPAAQGISDAYDYVRVQHYDAYGRPDGVSLCYLRSYDQGRERIQAMTLDLVWFDEEPDQSYYLEGLTRTNAVLGPVMLTFTPLKGMSDVVRRYLVDRMPGTHETCMALDDAEHYTPEQRAKILASYPAHERDARARGVPTLGSGRIFPVAEERIAEPSIAIPRHWPRIAALDFGYDHPSAVVWLAWDREADTVHVYDCHRQREATPVVHAAAVRARGPWIPVAWPHDGLQHDKGGSCEALAEQYRKLDVAMLRVHATHPPAAGQMEGTGGFGVEAGILSMLERMESGRLRVASHLADWFEEFRLYHRKDGKIVKKGDDLMSATRVGLMMLRFAKTAPEPSRVVVPQYSPLEPAMGMMG